MSNDYRKQCAGCPFLVLITDGIDFYTCGIVGGPDEIYDPRSEPPKGCPLKGLE